MEIPVGKIKCYITGKLRKDTPEERVRQSIAKSLVEEYGYKKEDIEVEFTIKIGSKKKRVDIVIFDKGKEHKQENIFIIVEAKREDIKPSNKKEGIEQLKSYVASSLNCKFGLWIGSERIAFEKIEREGKLLGEFTLLILLTKVRRYKSGRLRSKRQQNSV